MVKKKRRIVFWATRRVPKRVSVSFRTSYGERVSFTATRRVPKRVKVSFWSGIPGKKIKRRRR